jgi:hypothetical protein
VTATGATCDAFTAGTDTYTATFEVDASGEAEDLIITSDFGTPSPATVLAGNITTVTVTGATEGSDVTLTATNSICDVDDTQSSPVCVPTPTPSCGAGETSLAFDSFEGGTTATAVNPATYQVGGDVWASVSSLGPITGAQAGTDFWGMQDLDNGNGGGAFDHDLVYDVAFAAGTYTSINVSFYYHEVGFDGSDNLNYRYTVGTDSEVVVTLDKSGDGTWIEETVSIPVDPAATTFQFVLSGIQNGGTDYAGYDELNICGSTTPACTASLSAGTGTCDAITAGTDTYSATFTYDASGETLDLNVSSDFGTPDLGTITAGTAGTITVTGVNEGQDVTLTITNTSCDLDATVTSPVCVPTANVIITEIMQNPAAVADGSGEYFELHNLDATPVDIEGWEVADAGSNSFTIANGGPLVIAPGGYLVLGINGDSGVNGGVTVDYTMEDPTSQILQVLP